MAIQKALMDLMVEPQATTKKGLMEKRNPLRLQAPVPWLAAQQSRPGGHHRQTQQKNQACRLSPYNSTTMSGDQTHASEG
ncbi:hypothetical protein PVT67_12570 [Gallaecimonas kandeliae]|uniref:hypothetical protein n=1 Tax=Gallaecimonas kandeliae TaxID=3029055 RepID=UPI002647E716|nr:hypothetical protein [Gallaecimonas kandeliae]WKE64499.1 hypothetical protein PVT67_12570 [Gallaecimonas kandeliae]